MIDALEFKRHKSAASLFVAFNILRILLWVFGVALTTAFLIKTDPPPVSPAAFRPSFGLGSSAQAAYAAQMQSTDQTMGFARTLTASFLFTGYLGAGLVCLFLGHALRYLASIAEAAGKHASAYLDVVTPKQP